MSVARTHHLAIQYRWCLQPMIPWYRQVFALFLSLGIIMIALWGIEQSPGRYVVLGAMAMSFISLLLVFGVEIEQIDIELGPLSVTIPFTSTGEPRNDDKGGDE